MFDATSTDGEAPPSSAPEQDSHSSERQTSEPEASTSTDNRSIVETASTVPQEPLVLDIAQVWSGHPVKFALVTSDTHQYAAYYAANQNLTVASRELTGDTWTYKELPTRVGWDSHNHIAMALDEEGYIHVSGNMHNVPLVYFRSTDPGDIATLAQVFSMVGRNEQSVTYPEFFRAPTGALAFAHRDGGSGNGNHIFNEYDVTTKQWKRLLDTALTDGEGQRNAYPVGPIQGPDGYWHLVWVWRDTPDADTNHNLSYARTRDLVSWEAGDTGQAVALPMRLGTADIVDPVPVSTGLINNNTKVGFDADNKPVIVYHKYDANGKTQLYNARVEGGKWVVHQTSDWDYRWDFGGEGTLVFEIEVEGVQVQPDGRLTQTFYHAQYGGWGAFELDPVTLRATGTIDPPLPYPKQLDEVESTTEGMHARWASDWGASLGAGPNADGVRSPNGFTYLLRWETLDSNRDMPRTPVPPPTQLRLYGFPSQ